jgi:FKBP-type peptidyl-prolyl cis-trans isomerase SlyD
MPDAGFQAGPDTVVSIAYAVYDAEGERVDASEQPLDVVFGMGQLLPELEQAIEGLSAGDTRSVRLRPEQAYGRRDPTALMEVERSDFPDDVAPGDRYEAETPEGDTIVLRVLEVTDDAVVIDTNHPLADQTVRFELQVVAVRPASAAELRAAAERLEAENQAAEAGPAAPDRSFPAGSASALARRGPAALREPARRTWPAWLGRGMTRAETVDEG